jgi:hypothetical protein
MAMLGVAIVVCGESAARRGNKEALRGLVEYIAGSAQVTGAEPMPQYTTRWLSGISSSSREVLLGRDLRRRHRDWCRRAQVFTGRSQAGGYLFR